MSQPTEPGSAPWAIDTQMTKDFGSTRALHAMTLQVARGTMHGLVGENGAGKSTACRAIAGVSPAVGWLRCLDQTFDLSRYDVQMARRAGIGMVHQHRSLIDNLTVLENAVLWRATRPCAEPSANAHVARVPRARRVWQAAQRWLRRPDDDIRSGLQQTMNASGFSCRLDVVAGDLPVEEAQRAEILLQLWNDTQILILDEPTALLAPAQAEALLTELKHLVKEHGRTVLLVTHRLGELAEHADTVTVLRKGRTVGIEAPSRTEHIAALMMTDEPAAASSAAPTAAPAAAPAPEPRATPFDGNRREQAPSPRSTTGVAHLEIQALRLGPWSYRFELTADAGEMVGIAGITGNGQHELIDVLAGVGSVQQDPTARIRLAGVDLTTATARARRQAGLFTLAADRHAREVISEWTLSDNAAIGRWDLLSEARISRRHLTSEAAAIIEDMAVMAPGPSAYMRGLSGGNQQRFVIGRALRSPGLAALCCAYPTRGIDRHGAELVWNALHQAAQRGVTIVALSSDTDELLQHCHRVVVIDQGRIRGEARTHDELSLLMASLPASLSASAASGTSPSARAGDAQ